MAKSIMMVLMAATAAACSSTSADEGAQTAQSSEGLTGPSGTGFFGSDTLFDAITAAVAASPAAGSLTYLGTGSGNGEKCLRGQAVSYNGTTYCNGTKDQSIAPMSRNLNGCQAGEVSHRIALDAIGIWSAQSQSISDLSLKDVHDAFCGTDGSGSAAACTVKTWGALSNGASSANPSATIVKYRRDDASGTTDTFKAILANNGLTCSAFCSDVVAISDSTSGPVASNGSTIQPPCLSTDSATDCIGRLTAANSSAVAYAGLSATAKASPKALSVAGKTPTVDNIRALIASPASAYAFARFLFLNENTTNTRAAAESKFLGWSLGKAPFGSASTSLTFEQKLTGAGFIACTDPTASGHKALDCGSGYACP